MGSSPTWRTSGEDSSGLHAIGRALREPCQELGNLHTHYLLLCIVLPQLSEGKLIRLTALICQGSALPSCPSTNRTSIPDQPVQWAWRSASRLNRLPWQVLPSIPDLGVMISILSDHGLNILNLVSFSHQMLSK